VSRTAYRIGDSNTSMITPMTSCLGLIVALALHTRLRRRYADRDDAAFFIGSTSLLFVGYSRCAFRSAGTPRYYTPG